MVDLRLYALIDPERSGGRALDDLARRVVQGGATLIQLRNKQGSTRELLAQARAVKAALRESEVPLLINDRVDIVLASGADGVHVGQDDMPADVARRLLGPTAIVGLTVRSLAEAAGAPLDLVDYVAIGGVFATASKRNPQPAVGIAGLREIAAAVRARAPNFPIVAIAGIDRSNATQVVAAGADGIAVISALSLAPEPTGAARELRSIVDAALDDRTHRSSISLPAKNSGRARP
jgi:thiamine-phosphate pyrophosphorylase